MGLHLPKAYAPLERGYHGVVPGIAVGTDMSKVDHNKELNKDVMEYPSRFFVV